MSVDCLAGLVILGILLAALLIILSANEVQRRMRVTLTATMLYDGLAPDASPLVAHMLRMEGRPALVTRALDGSVTVELIQAASGPTVAATPDVLRLTAEALVAEEALGITITHGALRFTDRTLTMPITPALRALVMQRLAELRAAEAHGPHLTRQEGSVCRACAYRAMCAIGRVNAPLPHSSMR